MLAALSVPAHAAVQAPVVTRLPNGLTLLVKQDDRFPLVSLRLYVHAGSAYETPDISGLSHLLEHMVFKGTDKFPKGAVAETVERSGGYLNAATSFDYTVYQTDMTQEHWTEGLTVLKEQAFHATIDPKELEPEKEVVISELKRGEDNPQQRLFRLTQEKALAGTPYERPIIGTEQIIHSITADRMHAYVAEHYQPQSMLLVVVGKVKPDEALAQAEKAFGDLKNTRNIVPAKPLPLPKQTYFSVDVHPGPWNKVYLSVALPVPGSSDADAPGLDVLAQILGGDASSRFYREFKYDKRLVDSISVANYSFERIGLLYIQAVLDADKLEPFWNEFTKTLADLPKMTFTKAEFDRASLNLEDDLLRSKETLSGDASKLGWFQFFDKGVQGETDYLKQIRAADQTQMNRLIREYITPDNLTITLLTPKDATAPKGYATTAEFLSMDMVKNMQATPVLHTPPAEAPVKENMQVLDVDGSKVILIPDKTLPYASASLIFSGGDSLLSPKEQGLAAFTASLLTHGAGGMSATQMEDFQTDRAASLTAAAGRQSFSISVDSPSRNLDDMLGLVRTTLEKPAFAETEATRVRENQIAAIERREESPTGLAFRRMFPFLFGDHPYGFLAQGDKATVEGFTGAQAKAFWQKQLAQPHALVLAGDFNQAAAIAFAKSLPKATATEARPGAPGWTSKKELDLHLPGRNQAHLLMVFPTVGYGAPDEPGLDLLQNILAGQSGLLFSQLRDKEGLGYTVTAFPWKADKTGALIFYIGTSPDKLDAARAGFKKVIDELHTDLVPTTLVDGAKSKMLGDYYRDHQTLGARGSEAAALAILGRPLDAERTLVDAAQKVTPEQLRDLAVKYLQPAKAHEVVVQP